MDRTRVLKAIAEETRLQILTLLLQYKYCVRALARKLNLTEAAVSQHLKVLREAELLKGERKGYFMHYEVNRSVLHAIAADIEELAAIERQGCTPKEGGCSAHEQGRCHMHKEEDDARDGESCSDIDFKEGGVRQSGRYRNCHCHKPE